MVRHTYLKKLGDFCVTRWLIFVGLHGHNSCCDIPDCFATHMTCNCPLLQLNHSILHIKYCKTAFTIQIYQEFMMLFVTKATLYE